MSWFDASGIANLAKSALKEAQKTIDKALDIKDEEHRSNTSKASSPANPEEDTENFFATWGLKANNENNDPLNVENKMLTSPSKESPSQSGNKLAMSASLWGSFTGSFFDNPRSIPGEGSEDAVLKQPKKITLFRTESNQGRKGSWDRTESEEGTLCDDSSELGVEEGFSRSKLVVESEDGDMGVRSRLSSCDDDGEIEVAVQLTEEKQDVEVARRGGGEPITSNYKYNRLSVISSESDKKSSESVEVLGSASSEGGSGFTTSPESDMPLLSPASSSVMELKLSTSPDSVEVIPDTPSSVEVLCEDSTSPFLSPVEPPKTLVQLSRYQKKDGKGDENCDNEKISPESVEVIPEEDEDEEDMSVADDSYTSASESTATATTTIMELPSMVFAPSDVAKSPLHISKLQCGAESSSNESSLYSSIVAESSDLKTSPHPTLKTLESVNMSLESRPSLQLLLSTDGPSGSAEDKGGFKSVRIANKTHASEYTNEENSLLSDSRTLVNTDSSCEGTIMESSSEETIVPTMMDEAAGNQQTHSYYVKTLLADAMGEEDTREARIEQLLPARDHSPISSESRSDMVKVESEETSGHTSGDELETTTSSDIEIISSPNGDSSSTQSRQSPAKLPQRAVRVTVECSDAPSLEKATSSKLKGHQRELSETSSGGSEDSHYLEVEKLLKRVAEMTEVLEARESELIEMSRSNIELQEGNSDLKSLLEAALQSKVAATQDVHHMAEEFTQRLSSLECKFQQAIRDKEALRKQVEVAKCEAATRLSATQLETLVAEKDEIISELRQEGEKLSKQQLQHSNIIKKLRAKEKESENVIKNQKDQLDELNEEVERLKRLLTAKEEVERTQIEAVHQLTARTNSQEKELGALRVEVEEAHLQVDTLKNSLQLVHNELGENKKQLANKDKELSEALLSAELSVRQELLTMMDETRHTEQEEREGLLAQVEELHLKLRQAEEKYLGRETNARQECNDLLRRLEQAEVRNEELAQSVSLTTRPLLRQLESLQAASSIQQAAWEKQERNLSDMISELQGRIASLTEQERVSREQCLTLRSRVSSLESRLASLNQEATQLRANLEQQQIQCSHLQQARDKDQSGAESLRMLMTDELAELRRELVGLEQQLSVERAATEAEKRKCSLLQDQLREREVVDRDRTVAPPSPLGTPQSSPTLSFRRASLSDSISSTTWLQDDAFDCASSSGRYSNVYDSVRSGNTTSLLEGLQAQLKLRNGEMQQLQWELSRRDTERAALTTELSKLMARVEEQEQRLQEATDLRRQYEDVQHKYDALLQMYGEKVEETQELRLDLEDVKEMYKTQIDQLLKKEPAI